MFAAVALLTRIRLEDPALWAEIEEFARREHGDSRETTVQGDSTVSGDIDKQGLWHGTPLRLPKKP
jgi:hypothetical protein